MTILELIINLVITILLVSLGTFLKNYILWNKMQRDLWQDYRRNKINFTSIILQSVGIPYHKLIFKNGKLSGLNRFLLLMIFAYLLVIIFLGDL